MTTRNAVLEMFLASAWTTVPMYSGAGITITRGHEPDGSWPRPTSIEAEINNDSLNYDPSRPESTLYGVAGRNTKTRLTVDGNTRVWAEASSWRPERTVEHQPGAAKGRSWTKLTAEGVLRRIGMWTDPLRSPMYRTISARATNIGHWSLEDDRDALTLANSASGGGAATYKGGATLGEDEAPQGAAQSVKVVTGSAITGRFVSASSTAGWQVVFSAKLAALPSGAGYQSLLTWTTSNGYTWSWTTNNANYFISVIASDGTVLYNNGTAWSSQGPPTDWMTFRLKASVSGGTVTIEPAWYKQNAPVVTGFTDTFAGSVGALYQFTQVGASYTDGAHFSHIFAVTGVADSLTSGTAIAVFNGYLNEPAGTRFMRLCAELGITAYMIGTAADTALMGPQRAITFMSLLKEIRETDDARIDDERFDIGLTMRTRRSMYNQAAALTLTYPSQVAVPFAKILDDLNTHNVVTAKNASGGEATASLTSGPMSVQAPPAGVGEYKTTVDVNVANESTQLIDLATWHRAKGTLERPRYAEITVDLLANPSLVGAACAVREGDMIAVTGAEPETVRFMVVGIVEKVGAIEWTITFQVELYDVWIIGVYDDGTWRWDTASTTLAEDLTLTETIWDITTANVNDVLTTAAGSIPFDVMVGGERCTVTSVTAPAGTGPYTQQIVCTRSVNGVVKTHPTGEQISIYNSRRWGL